MFGFLPRGGHARARWPQAATLDLQRNLRASLISMPRIPLKVVTSVLNSYPSPSDRPAQRRWSPQKPDQRPRRITGLVPDEHHLTQPITKHDFEVVDDSLTRAHTAASNHNSRASGDFKIVTTCW